MKKVLIACVLVVTIFSLMESVNSQQSLPEYDCSKSCILQGFTSGVCRPSCEFYEQKTGGVFQCSLTGLAALTMGTSSIATYKNGDPFIGEKKSDPDWIWILSNLDSNQATDISDTSDSNQHTGIILGVKNKFIAKSLSSVTSEDAISVGGKKCFLNDYICIIFDSLTESSYGSYVIIKENTDLSNINSTWNSKPTILIQSLDDDEGLNTQIGTATKTDKIWITHNHSDTISLIYEDSNNVKQLAGEVQTGSNTNIADVEFEDTKNSDVQINIMGNISIVDDFSIVLDVLGDEGLVATDGYDDITINISHSASGDFDGIGDNPSQSEISEIKWKTVDIGKKTTDLLTSYGIKILNPDQNGAQDKVLLEIPGDQVKANIKIIGKSKEIVSSANIEKKYGNIQKISSPVLPADLDGVRDKNLILIGNPCYNPPITALFGVTCVDWLLMFENGHIRLAKNGEGTALWIAGKTGKDFNLAGEVLMNHRELELKGSELEFFGENLSDINFLNTKSNENLDIFSFPYPFVKNQNYDFLTVLSENSNIEESKFVTKLGTFFLNKITGPVLEISDENSTTDVTIEISDAIPLGNNLADSGFFNEILGDGDILTLKDEEISISGVEYDIQEKIVFFNFGPTIHTSLTSSDDNYKDIPYMEIEEGEIRYYYHFDESVDLEGIVDGDNPLNIKLFEDELSITSIESDAMIVEDADKVFLQPGDSRTFSDKKVTLISVNDDKVILDIDGNRSIIENKTRKTINGINIKANALFPKKGADCCCFNVLKYFN